MALNKKFDDRMELYAKKVKISVYWKNVTQSALTAIACFAVFMVWFKLNSIRKQYLM